jgi:hypothetical protein
MHIIWEAGLKITHKQLIICRPEFNERGGSRNTETHHENTYSSIRTVSIGLGNHSTTLGAPVPSAQCALWLTPPIQLRRRQGAHPVYSEIRNDDFACTQIYPYPHMFLATKHHDEHKNSSGAF